MLLVLERVLGVRAWKTIPQLKLNFVAFRDSTKTSGITDKQKVKNTFSRKRNLEKITKKN